MFTTFIVYNSRLKQYSILENIQVWGFPVKSSISSNINEAFGYGDFQELALKLYISTARVNVDSDRMGLLSSSMKRCCLFMNALHVRDHFNNIMEWALMKMNYSITSLNHTMKPHTYQQTKGTWVQKMLCEPPQECLSVYPAFLNKQPC